MEKFKPIFFHKIFGLFTEFMTTLVVILPQKWHFFTKISGDLKMKNVKKVIFPKRG